MTEETKRQMLRTMCCNLWSAKEMLALILTYGENTYADIYSDDIEPDARDLYNMLLKSHNIVFEMLYGKETEDVDKQTDA
jgi:hypothetical protein